ncbi:MAG: Bro-N domain-containing protein [Roseibium sp.]|uniref:BRO-N domain-containing protein n=1 Tax=Roseibium sp. TaxID=1936156 RepID=UPI001B2E798A|nr:Bro-N domain-containing protein [Roseibium sp.]
MRVVEIDGEPWFVARDVCSAVDFLMQQHVFRKLNADEMQTITKKDVPDTSLFPGRQARVKVISESSLYKLVMRSDKPQANPFQCPVTKNLISRTAALGIGRHPVCLVVTYSFSFTK